MSFNRFLDQPCAEDVFPADLETPTESSRNSEEMNGVTLESFVVPSQNEESSIEDDTPETDKFGENPAVTFHLIEDGSQKGKKNLQTATGIPIGNKVWTCSVRNKTVWCKASVIQKGAEFIRGSNSHVHPAKLGAAAATRITSAVKKQAAAEIFTSAAEIVNKVKIVYAYYY